MTTLKAIPKPKGNIRLPTKPHFSQVMFKRSQKPLHDLLLKYISELIHNLPFAHTKLRSLWTISNAAELKWNKWFPAFQLNPQIGVLTLGKCLKLTITYNKDILNCKMQMVLSNVFRVHFFPGFLPNFIWLSVPPSDWVSICFFSNWSPRGAHSWKPHFCSLKIQVLS